jgi:hypothetical protein
MKVVSDRMRSVVCVILYTQRDGQRKKSRRQGLETGRVTVASGTRRFGTGGKGTYRTVWQWRYRRRCVGVRVGLH